MENGQKKGLRQRPRREKGENARLVHRLWRFLGRMGLALRRILTWLIWKPLVVITFPIWLPLSWVWEAVVDWLPGFWRFVGRMGLALRTLLTRFLLQPLRFLGKNLLVRPLVFMWRRLLVPFARLIWRLWTRAALVLQRWWRRLYNRFLDATAPQRLLLRRRLHSRRLVWKARWQTRRRKPPADAVVAPVQPRSMSAGSRAVRLATAVAAVALLAIVAALSLRDEEPAQVVVADSNFRPTPTPQVIILTPTPEPRLPTPTPDINVKLTPWPTPDPLQGGGTVLFTQHIGGNSDIYMLPVGEGEAVRLTSDPAPDRGAVWSPDGTQIAFSSRRDGNWELYIYDIVRDELRRVTDDPAFDNAPSWSPDSQWLVYESYQDDNLDIYLRKADGTGNPLRLTSDPAPDFDPVWSPDGRHIAFTSRRTGSQEVFLRSLDDPNGERVINVSANPDAASGEPAFALDGRTLVYVSLEGDFPLLLAQPLSPDYFLDGPPQPLGQQGGHPAWAPDGRSLVFIHTTYSAGVQQQFLVAASPNAFGLAPQLFAAAGQVADPTWANVNVTPNMLVQMRHFDGRPIDEPLYIEAITQAERGETAQTLLFELPVNAPSPYLSDRVDDSFSALRERVRVEAGWDFLGQLDGMFAQLDEYPLPDPAANVWNKAGRAFDFYYREALGFDPQVEVVPEEIDGEMYWRVYVRAARQDGTQGEPLRLRSWDFTARSGDDVQYYAAGGKLRETVVSGYYIDFTALAADYGWQRVPAAANWRTFFPDIRFWHFQNRGGLDVMGALRELYSTQQLRGITIE